MSLDDLPLFESLLDLEEVKLPPPLLPDLLSISLPESGLDDLLSVFLDALLMPTSSWPALAWGTARKSRVLSDGWLRDVGGCIRCLARSSFVFISFAFDRTMAVEPSKSWTFITPNVL